MTSSRNEADAGAPGENRNEDIPFDPALAAMQAKLRRFVFVSMGTLGIGLLAVLFAIAWRAVNSGKEGPSGPAFEASAELPVGSRVVDQSVDGDRLVVTVETDQGRQVLLFDLRSGRKLGTVQLLAR